MPNPLYVQYFGGDRLCEISRIISEEYRARGGGLPDLLIWHDEMKCCKFVEVKGPGDKLSETQKARPTFLIDSTSITYHLTDLD